jgi:hypothetical protein
MPLMSFEPQSPDAYQFLRGTETAGGNKKSQQHSKNRKSFATNLKDGYPAANGQIYISTST